MAVLGQRIPLQENEYAWRLNFQSKQRVGNLEEAIIMCLFDAMRNQCEMPQCRELVQKCADIAQWDLRLIGNSDYWMEVYWSPDFLRNLKELSKAISYVDLTMTIPMVVLFSGNEPYVPLEYSQGIQVFGLQQDGNCFYALYWSSADADYVPLDCLHKISVSEIRNILPKRRFSCEDLKKPLTCAVCYKESSVGRVLRVLHRKEFIAIFTQCDLCPSKATFKYACGCRSCDEHVKAVPRQPGDQTSCTRHNQPFTLYELQVNLAVQNSLRSMYSNEFEKFRLHADIMFCKGEGHLEKVKADFVLHDLCCLCQKCHCQVEEQLRNTPQLSESRVPSASCPLCCAPVFFTHRIHLSQPDFDQTVAEEHKRIDPKFCCVYCSSYSLLKVQLKMCQHCYCLACIQDYLIGKKTCCCETTLHRDDVERIQEVLGQLETVFDSNSEHANCRLARADIRSQVEKMKNCFTCRCALTTEDVQQLMRKMVMFNLRE